MQYADQKDPTLGTFFRTHWQRSLTGISTRRHRPTYKLGTTPLRNTLERLVFEAMGSTANPSDFVLCDDEINNYKKRLWARENLMAPGRYTAAVQEAMTGAITSSEFLSALRLVSSIFLTLLMPR